MQIKYLHKNVYKLNSFFSRYFSEKKSNEHCREWVKHWQLLRKEGVSEKICQQIVGISRSSDYRYKAGITQRQPLKRSRRPKCFRKRHLLSNPLKWMAGLNL